MNEKLMIQTVRRVTHDLLNKYVILAMMLCSFGLVSAQKTDGKVSGTVLSDKDGEPLIGVSVMVKGTGIGTITDFNGVFTIEAKTGETLMFSYIGYLAQELKVTGAKMSVRLQEDTKNLDEIV